MLSVVYIFFPGREKKKMNVEKKHILIVEPYYGGSHKNFLDGLVCFVDLHFSLITLPARKWKMRMQTAAPFVAERIARLYSRGDQFDAVFCSTFIDVAVLRSLLAMQGIHIPVAVYFHENQFAYPVRIRDPSFFQFTSINFTTALAADRLFFNSLFNLESFISGITMFLNKAADVDIRFCLQDIKKKSIVLYPGIDYSIIDRQSSVKRNHEHPVIIWNHRWEHDKDPEAFFNALFKLQEQKVAFKVIVLGESFKQRPEIFSPAEQQLRKDNRIIHFGYVSNRNQYARLLCRGDLIISTALHEFFGISMLEGVRAGCRPLVPNHLSYPELFPRKFRYEQGELGKALTNALAALCMNDEKQRQGYRQIAAPYSWPLVAENYQRELTALCGR